MLLLLNIYIYIAGSIEANFAEMKNLVVLDLSGNSFSKSLPGSIGGMTALQSLVISNNQLSIIPQSIGLLAALTFLDISSNSFSAGIKLTVDVLYFVLVFK